MPIEPTAIRPEGSRHFLEIHRKRENEQTRYSLAAVPVIRDKRKKKEPVIGMCPDACPGDSRILCQAESVI